MKATLNQGPNGSPNFCFELLGENGEEIEFVQSDWGYAPLAQRFGWVPCPCGHTDGTVKCEHRTVSDMLSEAFDYLADRDGEEIEVDDSELPDVLNVSGECEECYCSPCECLPDNCDCGPA